MRSTLEQNKYINTIVWPGIKINPPTCDNTHKNENDGSSEETKLTVSFIFCCPRFSWFIVRFVLFGIWQLRKKMCLIIINIMLIAELERCGEELLINSQSKVITRNFHGFFQIRYQYIRNRVLASLKIEKLLELQKILPSRKGKLSLYKKE